MPDDKEVNSALTQISNELDKGTPHEVLARKNPAMYMRFPSGIKQYDRIVQGAPKSRKRQLVMLLEGPSRCGKSSFIKKQWGGDQHVYEFTKRNMKETENWEGYDKQRCVLFDEYREFWFSLPRLLKFFDRSAQLLNVKYSSANLVATRWCIATNESIRDLYASTGEWRSLHAFWCRIYEYGVYFKFRECDHRKNSRIYYREEIADDFEDAVMQFFEDDDDDNDEEYEKLVQSHVPEWISEEAAARCKCRLYGYGKVFGVFEKVDIMPILICYDQLAKGVGEPAITSINTTQLLNNLVHHGPFLSDVQRPHSVSNRYQPY